MLRSPFFQSRAFVFSLEALIALIIFVSFIQIAFIHPNNKGVLGTAVLRMAASDSLEYLQYSGLAVKYFDSDPLFADENIYAELVNILPPNSKFRIQITQYDGNAAQCAALQDFSGCFSQSPPKIMGEEIPSDRAVAHRRIVIASNGAPTSCSLGASFSGQTPLQGGAAHFASKAGSVFFASVPDLNIDVNFGLLVSPSESASCDEPITVDMNATVTASVTYGRHPADVMMVLDRSGSMSWDGLLDLTDPQDVFAEENYAFVADGSSGLRDINILDPASPLTSGTYNSPGTANGVFSSGNTAYLADGSSGLRIINTTTKSSPSSVGSLGNIGTAQRVFVSGSYAFVTTTTNGTNVEDFNIFASSNVIDVNIGQASPSANTYAAQSFVVTKSGYVDTVDAYVKRTGTPSGITASIRSSLAGADLASASVSSVSTSYAWRTASFSSPIFLTAGQTYYLVLSTSETRSGRYYTWRASSSSIYSSGNAFNASVPLASNDAFMRIYRKPVAGLQIINISTPSNPVYYSSIAGTDPQDVFVDGNYAYFTDGTAGLKIVDVSNPSGVSLSGSIDSTDAGGLHVSGSYAFVSDGSSGLRIINITNKSSPVISSTFNTSGTATDAFLYSDGNVYVADGTAVVAVNVSNPLSPVLAASYSTPYSGAYERIHVINDWAFLTPGYNGALVTFSIYNGPKMSQLKVSANSFIDNNGWKSAYDQMGLVSFSSSPSSPIDQTLVKVTDGNKTVLKNLVSNLSANGGTAVFDSICAATRELTSLRAQSGAYKFIVALTDGVSNSDTNSYCYTNYGAAYDANNKGIKVYTIGFGGDADAATLAQIAGITGGNYYFASDQNALSGVFDLIAIDIGESLNYSSPGLKAYDANIRIPLSFVSGGDTKKIPCADILDLNGAVCSLFGDTNYLDFNAGVVDSTHPWRGHFTFKIPCDENISCGVTQLTLPFSGSAFNFTDVNSLAHSVAVDVNQTIGFKYRDLNVSVSNPRSVARNTVLVDVTVNNSGLLDADASTLEFFNGSIGLYPQKAQNVPALSSSESNSFLGESLSGSGWFYAVLNRANSVKECPLGNTASFYCSSSLGGKFFVIDMWVWV